MFAQYLLFAAEVFTLIIGILVLLIGIFSIASKNKNRDQGQLRIKKLNKKYEAMHDILSQEILDKAQYKQLLKAQKKQQKIKLDSSTARKRIFVITFIGDIRASAAKSLREEITGLLTLATPEDEIVLRLESAGGMVHAYGLAASQLQRIRNHQVPLVVIIDKIAASGGYMMAAVANRILAAPLAILGSLGVIAQVPNFHRLLKKNDIEFEQIMAGQYKRTLTLFGENTEQGREKFQEEVNETHHLFKAFLLENRPSLDIEKVATGEHWYGTPALALHLIDGISTSDDYLLSASKTADIYEICYQPKKTWVDKLSHHATKVYDACLNKMNFIF